ncbi:hypothetical protein TruAng_011572 [Truncatella angustata]|nr:hypothetical protein TruAng_011572 [Truncatella angustata]
MAEQGPSITLEAHFRDHAVDAHAERWNSLWKDHKFTPWDRGGPSMALSDLLEHRPDLFGQPASAALVPGCGRGHDVLLLESFGYDVVGLEVSPTALEEAQKNAGSMTRDGVYRRRGQHQGSHRFASGDFFKNTWTQEVGVEKFDLIFDYTAS